MVSIRLCYDLYSTDATKRRSIYSVLLSMPLSQRYRIEFAKNHAKCSSTVKRRNETKRKGTKRNEKKEVQTLITYDSFLVLVMELTNGRISLCETF